MIGDIIPCQECGDTNMTFSRLGDNSLVVRCKDGHTVYEVLPEAAEATIEIARKAARAKHTKCILDWFSRIHSVIFTNMDRTIGVGQSCDLDHHEKRAVGNMYIKKTEKELTDFENALVSLKIIDKRKGDL